MKLSTFMLEERFFKMQTPINPSREIALTPEFNDVEFDKFEISEHTISFFIKEDNNFAIYKDENPSCIRVICKKILQ